MSIAEHRTEGLRTGTALALAALPLAGILAAYWAVVPQWWGWHFVISATPAALTIGGTVVATLLWWPHHRRFALWLLCIVPVWTLVTGLVAFVLWFQDVFVMANETVIPIPRHDVTLHVFSSCCFPPDSCYECPTGFDHVYVQRGNSVFMRHMRSFRFRIHEYELVTTAHGVQDGRSGEMLWEDDR